MPSEQHQTILITGVAGFIGFHLAKSLLEKGFGNRPVRIVGVDNLNDYYDPALKKARLDQLFDMVKDASSEQFVFEKADICDEAFMMNLFEHERPSLVVHLAAQAGVRYSINHPEAYLKSNVIGFFNVLECCRKFPVEHLVYASSSSVYGMNKKIPYSVEDKVDSPVSLYAATKKTDELFAFAYSKLYDIPCTGLRFFTVYGPYGRPDMAYFSFTNKLIRGETIEIFNYGNCQRDFTYIDDVVEGIRLVMPSSPMPGLDEDGLPLVRHRLYNLGKGSPDSLLEFVSILQEELIRAGVLPNDYRFEEHKRLVPMQKGDVVTTFADTRDISRDFGYCPSTDLRTGLRRFAEWYRAYYL